MTLTLSNAVRSAMANTGLDSVDAGAAPGKIRIYTGAKPAGPDTAIGAQVLLVEIPLNDPAWAAAVNGVKDLDVTPIPNADAVAAGTAAWFRALDSDNVAKYDGTVGQEITLSSTDITIGLNVQITGGTGTMPAS